MHRPSCSIQSNLLARLSYTVCAEFQLEILPLSYEGGTNETLHVKFLSKTLWPYMSVDCIFYNVHITKTLAARTADNKAIHHDCDNCKDSATLDQKIDA